MFRNQYDNDVTVWSPQGRVHQIEYAMAAVKLGSATVGLKNKTHAVLIALKRASAELSAYQKKIIPIDTHIGIAIAGLTADGRILSRYMITESINYKYSKDVLIPVSRLIYMLGNKMQVCTQRYDRRPYGVGLLVAGYDDQGPHVYQMCPSANYFDCKAMAVGSGSQSARKYLKKHLDDFVNCDTDELIKHGLRALCKTLPNEVELNTKNVSIGLVGKETSFKVFGEEETAHYLQMIEGEEKRTGSGGAGTTPPEASQHGAPPPQPSPAGEGPEDPVPDVAMDTE